MKAVGTGRLSPLVQAAFSTGVSWSDCCHPSTVSSTGAQAVGTRPAPRGRHTLSPWSRVPVGM